MHATHNLDRNRKKKDKYFLFKKFERLDLSLPRIKEFGLLLQITI